MGYWLKFFTCASLSLLLASCQSIPDPSAAWTMKGRVAVKSPNDSAAWSIYWQQLESSFDLRLSGALGTTLARIHGPGRAGEGEACIDVRGKAPQCSASASDLLHDETGIRFPVEALQYWMRGLPSPGMPVGKATGGFRQAGWRVEYLARTASGLPRIILAKQDNPFSGAFSIRLVVSEWQ